MSVNTAICRYNKYGYCRFQDTCRYKHVEEVCDDSLCVADSCNKRHPRSCIYYQAYKRCKFGAQCKYKHAAVVSQSPTEEVSLLSKIDELKEEITSLRKENESLKFKLEAIERKVNDVDNRLIHVEVTTENMMAATEGVEQDSLLTPLKIDSGGVVDPEKRGIRQEESYQLKGAIKATYK